MTGERRPRRPRPVPRWFDQARAWLVHASGGVSLFVLVALGGATLGFGYYSVDLADRNTARDLVAHGRWAVAPDPLVHVVYYSGKGGGFFDVDEVKVRLPGVPDAVLLDVVDGPDMVEAKEGWQKPTQDTGYAGPLDVRYRAERDGTFTAMARADVDYWTIDNTDPETGLAIGFGGLAIAGLSLVVNSARVTRLERRRQVLRESRRTERRAASHGAKVHGPKPGQHRIRGGRRRR